MFSCPRCGAKGTGFMKLCGGCAFEVNLLTKSKSKIRPIDESEDEE